MSDTMTPTTTEELPSVEANNAPAVPTQQAAIKPVGGATMGSLAAIAISPGGYGQSSHPFLTCASGTVTLAGATPVVVPNPNIGPNSVILFGLKTLGGTPEAVVVTAVVPGVSFTVTGLAGDSSTYNWMTLG